MRGEFFYLLGIQFCIQNNVRMACYWLKRAVAKGHKKATKLLRELEDIRWKAAISNSTSSPTQRSNQHD